MAAPVEQTEEESQADTTTVSAESEASSVIANHLRFGVRNRGRTLLQPGILSDALMFRLYKLNRTNTVWTLRRY